MEDETKPMCRSGCGCFGNPATDGLCSICYKALVSKKQSRLNTSAMANANSCSGRGSGVNSYDGKTLTFVDMSNKSNETSTTMNSTPPPTSSPLLLDTKNIVESHKYLKSTADAKSTGSSTSCNKDDQIGQRGIGIRKSLRCAAINCHRKLGLTDVQCRCGGHFCAIHRYSDRHECSFDYRGLGAQEIRRKNPKVVSEKIQKI